MITGDKPDWFPDWQGQYAAIIGGGNSIKRSEIELLRNRLKVVVINEGCKLAPWADVLYSCDADWWRINRGRTEFTGLRITQDAVAVKEFTNLRKIDLREKKPGEYVEYLLMDRYGEVGSGQCSGFQALNLIAQWGVRGVALLGFDACRVENKIHWHPDYGTTVRNTPMRNPDNSVFIAWKRWMEAAAQPLAALGIEVVNCSMVSTIGCFPRFSVAEILTRWKL